MMSMNLLLSHFIKKAATDLFIATLALTGTAGAITFTGFTVGASTGDALTTTNASKFTISVWRINGVSSYVVKALQ